VTTNHTRLLRRLSALGLTGLVSVAMMTLAPPALADDLNTSQGLRKAVTLAGVREHQQALQDIATNVGGGNRLAGTAGHDASADYVKGKLEAAGYTVSLHTFTFTLNSERTPSELQQISPTAVTYVNGVDFAVMTYSGSGDVTAPVTAVDLVLPPAPVANTSTSGCEAADFVGFPAGNIALVQRGTCSFAAKATNAMAAGASAVIVFNEGQAGRTAVINGTLGGPIAGAPPVVGSTFALGDDLANGVANGATGSTARVRTDMINEERQTSNVIADTPTGDPNNVILVGAHLDSVSRGPGINDNGSGSAGILEIAEQFAARGITPRNMVRFAWWSAEELGLIGSREYVNSRTPAELAQIEMNLNFDMIGSPNFVRFVYDGDNSAFPVGPGSAVGPQGSGEIERVFHHFFSGVGLASAETPFSGRSDYGPFIEVGIPAGGLFTGAEGVKTAEEAAVYGGTAGAPYDPCYHLACDTYANNSNEALDQMTDAATHTILYFAKRNFAKNPLVNPAGPVGPGGTNGGGGGLHDEHDEPVAS